MPDEKGKALLTDIGTEELGHVEMISTMAFQLMEGGDSLSEASTFIECIEKRQGLKVACLEEIAYKQGWIGKEQLKELAKPMLKNGYGKYLMDLVEGK